MKWPSLTIYTDRLPDGVGGVAHGPLVLIRPQYRADEGIHQHEYEHVGQWWVAGLASAVLLALVDVRLAGLAIGVHPALYYLVRPYRLWAEVCAYRVQRQFPNASGVPLSLDGAAMRLMSPRYDLRLSVAQARALLQ